MSQREDKSRREKSRRERVRRKKIQMCETSGKSRNSVFPMICGSGGSKSRLAKAADAEPRSTGSDHFWRDRFRKRASRCGAKHICKSKR